MSGRGWARVSSVPAVGTGHSREWDTTGQGPVALYPPCCVQPHLVCMPRVPGARAGESTDVPWVQPGEGRCRAGLSETRSSAGDGERLGGHRALPQEQRVLSLAGSHGRQSRRCTRTASDIIIILIMKGQLLQSSSSPRRRERRMQRRRVSLIPSSRGESAAVPGWSFAGPSPGR